MKVYYDPNLMCYVPIKTFRKGFLIHVEYEQYFFDESETKSDVRKSFYYLNDDEFEKIWPTRVACELAD